MDECDRDEDEDNYEEYKACICDNKLRERGDACFTIHKAAEEFKTGKESSHGYPERFYHNDFKSQGFSGCRALALPLGEPHPFRVSLNGMGCITYGKPGKMCIYIPTHMRER